MAKYTLKLDEDYDFDLIGLCSYLGDYRVCWLINKKLGLKLTKSLEPFMVSGKRGEILSGHSFYEWHNEEENVSYYLLKNKEVSKYLIPEKSQIDFFLIIKEQGIVDVPSVIEKLKEIQGILLVMDFDPNTLNSAERLAF